VWRAQPSDATTTYSEGPRASNITLCVG
jgi:hypothetical protein